MTLWCNWQILQEPCATIMQTDIIHTGKTLVWLENKTDFLNGFWVFWPSSSSLFMSFCHYRSLRYCRALLTPLISAVQLRWHIHDSYFITIVSASHSSSSSVESQLEGPGFESLRVEFAPSPCACVGSLWALRFPPTIHRHAVNWWPAGENCEREWLYRSVCLCVSPVIDWSSVYLTYHPVILHFTYT